MSLKAAFHQFAELIMYQIQQSDNYYFLIQAATVLNSVIHNVPKLSDIL